MEIDRKRDGVKDKRRRRVGLALGTIPIVIGCHRKAGSPREKKSRVPRGRGEGRVTRSTGGALGPHYGRYLVVGDITANCHPQKRNGPGAPLPEPRGVGRLLGASPTSRKVGFTTGARHCSLPLHSSLARSFTLLSFSFPPSSPSIASLPPSISFTVKRRARVVTYLSFFL